MNVAAGLERDGEKLDVSVSGYIRTNFTKAKTAIGCKLGLRW